ncbi:hypothetical protein [Sphingobium sp. UBA5915]|uniref:hypothetical protein n=1 Tax=Sphingobium sp. UBA5915 TaxID=1947530 RepID=UPI0025F3F08D|nr:hypothetical protein [Sphingobium sp. UBA5915]
MVSIHVTRHAADRYRERVCDTTHDQAVAALSSATIQRAASFGARHVILSGGQRVVIQDGRVITVLPKGWSKACAIKERE